MQTIMKMNIVCNYILLPLPYHLLCCDRRRCGVGAGGHTAMLRTHHRVTRCNLLTNSAMLPACIFSITLAR